MSLPFSSLIFLLYFFPLISLRDGKRRLIRHGKLINQIFARDVGTAPPHELVKVTAVNVPVKLQTDEQDMTINPGDYLIGDLNGVVVVPKDAAAEILPLMAKQVEADSYMSVELHMGMSFTEASKKFRM